MRLLRKVAVAGVMSAALVATVPSAASAAPSGTGFDDQNNTFVGGGSDTTYPMMLRIQNLYNGSPGCVTDNTSGSATLGQCLTGAAQTATDVNANWDHDIASNLYPTGSSAGVKALQLGQLDFARSSRAPKASGESDLNFWAYAKDGIAIVTMGTRSPANITKSQIQGIYNCTITQWGQIYGNGDTTPIAPYGMNASSGTKATMDSYLGFDANAGACVKKLSTGAYPFENDLKPIISDPAGLANNAIWWGSYAELSAFKYKRQSGQFWSVDGVDISLPAIGNNSYTIKRFVYHVSKKVDATPASSGAWQMTGTVGGPGGAVRQLTEWTCKPKASHSTDPYTGANYYDELTNQAIAGTGFQRIPAAERTNGACRLEPGA